MQAFAQVAVGLAALTVLTAAALQDLRERLIANRFSLALLALGLAWHTAGAASWRDGLSTGGVALALAALVFAFGYGLWRLGGVGGGDVKLLVATSFVVGADGLGLLLAGTALAGGALALLCLVLPALGNRLAATGLLPWPRATAAAPSVPYGVAIALGGCWALLPSIPPTLG